MRYTILILSLSGLFFSCNNSGKSKGIKTDTLNKADSLIDPANVDDPLRDSALIAQTKTVLTFFKNKQYDSLALFVHPDEGVRFSPYAFVDTVNDKVIKAETLRNWADKKKQSKMKWGEFDGTGDPINMKADDYLKRFVYDANFLKPDSLKVNEQIGGGNTTSNLKDIYPGCNFTESHFPGIDKKYEGMDWRSIRLVFKLKDGKYYLVGVVHDEWTT